PHRLLRSFPTRRSSDLSELDEMLAIMLELFNRLVNIGQRLVLAMLHKAAVDLGLPAQRQLFQGADINIPVMEVRFQPRHVLHHEDRKSTRLNSSHVKIS